MKILTLKELKALIDANDTANIKMKTKVWTGEKYYKEDTTIDFRTPFTITEHENYKIKILRIKYDENLLEKLNLFINNLCVNIGS